MKIHSINNEGCLLSFQHHIPFVYFNFLTNNECCYYSLYGKYAGFLLRYLLLLPCHTFPVHSSSTMHPPKVHNKQDCWPDSLHSYLQMPACFLFCFLLFAVPPR